MDPKLAKELDLRFFHDRGYIRKSCPKCGDNYWTLNGELDLCGDPPCVEYDFIGNPLTNRPFTIEEMREEFLSFFESKEHTRLDRYPVVARWRDDIYLTIASIADFQPFVTGGVIPPPANPLVISQPCIRLNDLVSVGKTGRHLTCFEMMGHHAFNRPDDTKYWTEECLRYADEFLVDRLGFDRSRITYKEQVWSGGGNAGPAVEVLSGGLEVATLVFMSLEAHPKGEFEAKGERYRRMDLQIIDTGWGLERLAWASQGAPNAYQVVFPEIVEHLASMTGVSPRDQDERTLAIMQEHARVAGVLDLDLKSDLHKLRKEVAKRLGERGITTDADELQRIMAPIEDTYAVADHTRCLAFMLADGVVPSNAKAGYLARLVVRRTLRLMEQLGVTVSIGALVVRQMETLKHQFPDLLESRSRVERILELETLRYKETVEKGSRLVARMAQKGATISEEQLVELYDSHGLQPDIVKSVAEPLGAKVDVPDAFDALVATMHEKEIKALEEEARPEAAEIPATVPLYYDTPDARLFEAKVLWSEGERIVLDRTCFYPDGGGQEEDTGVIRHQGKTIQVVDVQKDDDGHVFHHLEKGASIPTGAEVEGEVDWERRQTHMRHHTGVHILNGAAREVLGPHVWQMSAYKCEEYARLDISHFERLTQEELEAIERRANEIVLQAHDISRKWVPREEAESRHGFVLYQGGVAPGSKIRVVDIGGGVDVEACGGTHAANTAEVGTIKVVGVERVQDGVERIVIKCGKKAIDEIQRRDRLLKESSATLSVAIDDLPRATERFFEEWRVQRKQLEQLKKKLAESQKGSLIDDAEEVAGVKVVSYTGPDEMKDLLGLAKELTKNPGVVCVLGSGEAGSGKLVVARSDDVEKVNAGKAVSEAAPVMGGKGGGKPQMAQGGGPDGEKAEAAVRRATELVKGMLQG